MDIIYLHGLKIDTVIGMFPWERNIKQQILIDLDLAVDLTKVVVSDHIADTLDYDALAKRLTEFVGNSRFHLIEALAEQIAALIMAEFQVKWLKLRLTKPGAIPNASEVGVLIERG